MICQICNAVNVVMYNTKICLACHCRRIKNITENTSNLWLAEDDQCSCVEVKTNSERICQCNNNTDSCKCHTEIKTVRIRK